MAKVIIVTLSDNSFVGVYNNMEAAKYFCVGDNYIFTEKNIVRSPLINVSLLFKNKNFTQLLERYKNDGYEVTYEGNFGCTLTLDYKKLGKILSPNN